MERGGLPRTRGIRGRWSRAVHGHGCPSCGVHALSVPFLPLPSLFSSPLLSLLSPPMLPPVPMRSQSPVCVPHPLFHATPSLGHNLCLGSVCPASRAAQPRTMEWCAKLTVTLKAPTLPVYSLPLEGFLKEGKRNRTPPKAGEGTIGGTGGKGLGLSDSHFHYREHLNSFKTRKL